VPRAARCARGARPEPRAGEWPGAVFALPLLELLLPRGWSHPEKEFLRAWYGHRGYRLSRISTMDDAYPHLAPMLATLCDLAIYEKPL
jgi:hypothetical protein